MNLDIKEDYFNLVYAKKMSIPRNTYVKSRREVVEFLVDNIDEIDFLSINDVVIDIIKLINNNKILSRYLKLKKINNLL